MEREIEIRTADRRDDMSVVRMLFLEYADWLALDLCFQGFEEELRNLPGQYSPPGGGLWLAQVDGEPAGVIGLRPLEAGVCEFKRLWVRPPFRGLGLGRRLAETALEKARSSGYRAIRLDTIGSRMAAARAVYDRLGFKMIPPYYHNPHDAVCFLELKLA